MQQLHKVFSQTKLFCLQFGLRQEDTEPQLVQEYVVGSKVTLNFGDREQATDQKQPSILVSSSGLWSQVPRTKLGYLAMLGDGNKSTRITPIMSHDKDSHYGTDEHNPHGPHGPYSCFDHGYESTTALIHKPLC